VKNIISLDERLNELVSKKLTICECNPCVCTRQEKDQYFQEVKTILFKYNMEIFVQDFYKDHFRKTMHL
jgi:hypothetical protein